MARKQAGILSLLISGAALLCLASCDIAEQDQRMAGGGIETGNTGALSGRILNRDGYPMQNTQVEVVAMGFSTEGPTRGPTQLVATDTLGWYHFKRVPAGAFAIHSETGGETPMAALLTRVRTDGTALELQDMISQPSVNLEGRLLPTPGVAVEAVHACIPGTNTCVHPAADGVYRFPAAPLGNYELVFLTATSAHYLAVEVGAPTSDTAYLKDVALGDSSDGARIPYQFYASTLAHSFSMVPVEYPAGAEPAWYSGKDFSAVRYFLLNDGHPVPPLSVDYFSQWAYRRTLQGAALGNLRDLDAPLKGFALPVRLTAANFDFSQALPNGSDLVVSDGAGHLLPHEIERWDASGGKAEIWVRLDSLASLAADRSLTLHWGRKESVHLSGGAGVFRGEDGYIGVWHLNDRTPDLKVAEARGLYGGKLGCLEAQNDPNSVRTGEAVVAGGHRLGQGFACIDVAHQAGLDVSSEFTYLVWGKSYHHDAAHDQVLGSKWSKTKREWLLTLLANETVEIKFGDATGWTLGAVTTVDPVADPEKWHHYGVVFDQGAVRLFLDGREVRTRVEGGAVPDVVTRAGVDFHIGSNALDKYTNWEGDLDEAAYFSVAKPGDWLEAVYRTQKP